MSQPRKVSIPQDQVLTWPSQAQQYPYRGEPGLSYFAGETDNGIVHCLLYRDDYGLLLGILNYYDHDFPPYERAGNVNIFVHRNHKRQGIGSTLWTEAVRRWQVSLDGQRFSPEGLAFADALEREGLA